MLPGLSWCRFPHSAACLVKIPGNYYTTTVPGVSNIAHLCIMKPAEDGDGMTRKSQGKSQEKAAMYVGNYIVGLSLLAYLVAVTFRVERKSADDNDLWIVGYNGGFRSTISRIPLITT
ncbi:hypothetical protein K461DRAFT_156202 [Myriangium duriaei CBS 260.36]|uniref:Uncharacterized protein n=1 Tax=Myriangium duriaei CBS 260.36 TaxID=1168546 RepID=A0A9P4J1J0_9PEZI|nr:hypothetical protein K461DRAFT_156202 [Myriangium duriaei CBS 260.36]